MLQLYTTPSCASCRKVKKYFNEHNIAFTEKNIFVTPLTREEIYKMLLRSENGFDDIISTRSKIFKETGVNIEEMKINQLVDYIIENPGILKRPIIVSQDEIQVGYNDDDITLFLPPEIREQECLLCFNDNQCDYQKALKQTLH